LLAARATHVAAAKRLTREEQRAEIYWTMEGLGLIITEFDQGWRAKGGVPWEITKAERPKGKRRRNTPDDTRRKLDAKLERTATG
jgi:hypothetical protein